MSTGMAGYVWMGSTNTRFFDIAWSTGVVIAPPSFGNFLPNTELSGGQGVLKLKQPMVTGN